MGRRRRERTVSDALGVDLLMEVATRYYLRADSQIDIARDLDLDPSTVSRYLKRARDEGIVHVEIRRPQRVEADLGRDIATLYGLSRVVVAPSAKPTDGRTPDPALASTAARFVEGLLRNRVRLGVSWGRTVAAVVANLRPGSVSHLSVAQLAGGIADPGPGIQGHELVRRVAELYPESRVHYLHAPAIVDSAATGAALLGDRIIETALAAARASQVALVGIGQMDESATLVSGGHITTVDWQRLLDAGAAGNINTCFFDDEGAAIPDLQRRTIAISLDDLRAIETVVAVAAGATKARAIRGALSTGSIDVLVTDAATAEAVLASDGSRAAKPERVRRACETSAAVTPR